MSSYGFDQTLRMSGGEVTADNCPKVIPVSQYLGLVNSIHRLAGYFDHVSEKAGKKHRCFLALTNSTGFVCRVRPIDDGYAILVPLGVVARIHILAKLLIQYWGHESSVQLIRSPLDECTWDAEAIPPKLKPIFSEDFDDEEFWLQLAALDEGIAISDQQMADVYELTHLAFVYLTAHEFTHLLHGHFELLQNVTEIDSDLSKTEILRGMETDADNGASALSMWILQEDVNRAAARGQFLNLGLGWLRLTYAVTMIYAISDANQKYFGAFEDCSYSHPLVRCELFFSGVRQAMSTSTEEAKELWSLNSEEGWLRCIQALNSLELDALGNRYGQIPEGVPPSPLHTLRYSATQNMSVAEQTMLEECEKETELMLKVRRLLPLFKR